MKDLMKLVRLPNQYDTNQDHQLPYSVEFTDTQRDDDFNGDWRMSGINIRLHGDIVYTHASSYHIDQSAGFDKEKADSNVMNETIKEIFLQGLKHYIKNPKR